MASNINYQDINEAYPVAGVDNDSQGFRDNFGTIKNSLSAAKIEVEALQSTTVKNNADNIMNFNKIQQVELVQAQLGTNLGTQILANASIEYNRGHYQSFILAYSTVSLQNVVLQFTNWPDAGQYGKMYVQLASQDNRTRKVIWDTEASGVFKYSEAYNNFLTGYLDISTSLASGAVPGVGTTIEGQTSGATATVVAVDTSLVNPDDPGSGLNNRLILNNVKGNFTNALGGEVITCKEGIMSNSNITLNTGDNGWTAPACIIDSATTETILEFATYNGGQDVYVDIKGKFSI